MAREFRVPPSAASLSESMRDLGYSLETAVADILDNSIAARATVIDIFYLLADETSSLSIIDNGRGMSPAELLQAMKHGAVNPKTTRAVDDLGRFGLGLKTASFSQCRQMTIISRQDDCLAATQWDLDLVDQTDDWLINILDEAEIQGFDAIDELPVTGCMVVWRKLDRLFEELAGSERERLVNEKLGLLKRHLSLVFHRYLAGEFRSYGKLKIRVNGDEISPFDPFCRTNRATQLLPPEKVHIDGHEVNIQPYILPHHSKLSVDEYSFYQSRSDFISNQGAYIYRNGRLMAWGDWFRMVPKGEATKLARVQIDFTNALDESWTIDIKKSRARPPQPVRARMKQIITQITNRSTQVHRQRGQKLFDEVQAPIWERYADAGQTRYGLNMAHPLISALAATLNDEHQRLFDVLMSSISAALPLEMIYSDFASTPQKMQQPAVENDTVEAQLLFLKNMLGSDGNLTSAIFSNMVKSTCLFEGQQELISDFIRREFNE